ncbi:MAG: MFS transporter [Myxococcota bacterium]
MSEIERRRGVRRPGLARPVTQLMNRLSRVLGVAPGDRRDTGVGFVTLVALLGAHSMLETARDALFLDRLPVEWLPLAYLAIAGVALAVGRANQWAVLRYPRRRLLSLSLAVGGVVTAGFYTITGDHAPWALGALYVWSGLTTTVVVVQFWLQLGDVLDVGQAKRLFSIIGAGGVFGAVLGSGGASLLLEVVGPRELLLISGALFVVASALPMGFSPGDTEPAPRRRGTARRDEAPRMGVGEIAHDPYLRRLFVMVLVGALLVTGVDFLFKAKVVAETANRGWNLGIFLGRFYAVLNLGSLAVQLFIAPRLLSSVGVNRALLLMPSLLLLGTVGFALTIGIVPALLLKGADGTLRHSVHRTASEILYLPLPRRTRDRFKAFAEAIGQRGGQALASLTILGVTYVTDDAHYIAVGLVGLAAVFVLTTWGLEPHYLERFRQQLRDGAIDRDVDMPDLDLASFETLVSALSSARDAEVVAALEMFDIYGKTELVPALILFHPSRDVVLRAFDLFSGTDRDDVARLTGRLLDHDDDAIRAAALRVLGAGDDEDEMAVLRDYLDDPSPAVRCTALVTLVSRGVVAHDEAEAKLRAMLHDGGDDMALALAQTLRHLPAGAYPWLPAELARRALPEVLVEVARSLALRPAPAHLPTLINLVRRRESRREAQRALVHLGPVALDALSDALADTTLSPEVRRHLPRTIAVFGTQAAFDVLFDAVLRERDTWARWKILRGLGRLRLAHPELDVDRGRAMDHARATMRTGVRALNWRLAVEGVADHVHREDMAPSTELLVAFLEEKQERAVREVFRLLHIIEPREEFRIIYDALRHGSKGARASSRELLQHVVPSPLREGVLAMMSDAAAPERLQAARDFYDPPSRRTVADALAAAADDGAEGSAPAATARTQLSRVYADVLRDMLDDPSEALREIVRYHVEELSLDELTAMVGDAARTSDILGEVAPSDAFRRGASDRTASADEASPAARRCETAAAAALLTPATGSSP